MSKKYLYNLGKGLQEYSIEDLKEMVSDIFVDYILRQ